MSRRYFVPSFPAGGRFALPDAVARHLVVTRARVGESLVLFDGADREATVRLVRAERRITEVEIERIDQVVRAAPRAVELLVALPRGNRAEWLFEHATELGVVRFRPLVCARSRDVGRADRRERWERVVIAAAEQCDRSRLPVVDPELPLGTVLADASLPPERLVGLPGADRPLGPAGGPAAFCVGPEGGFTADEVAELERAGFAARALGPLTLRSETAALVGLARLLG